MLLPAKSLQRTPAKITVDWEVPCIVMKNPVWLTWEKSASVFAMTNSSE